MVSPLDEFSSEGIQVEPEPVYVHTCGGPVEYRPRTVIPQPDDPCWPQNFEAQLPYCIRCKAVVDLRTLVQVPE